MPALLAYYLFWSQSTCWKPFWLIPLPSVRAWEVFFLMVVVCFCRWVCARGSIIISEALPPQNPPRPPSTCVTPTPRTPSTIGGQPEACASDTAPPGTRGSEDPVVAPTDVALIASLETLVLHATRCLDSLLQYTTTAGVDTQSLDSTLRTLERSFALAISGPDYTLITAAMDGALLHDGHYTATYPKNLRPSSSFWHHGRPARELTMAMSSGPPIGVPASSFPGSTPGGTTPPHITGETIAAE